MALTISCPGASAVVRRRSPALSSPALPIFCRAGGWRAQLDPPLGLRLRSALRLPRVEASRSVRSFSCTFSSCSISLYHSRCRCCTAQRELDAASVPFQLPPCMSTPDNDAAVADFPRAKCWLFRRSLCACLRLSPHWAHSTMESMCVLLRPVPVVRYGQNACRRDKVDASHSAEVVAQRTSTGIAIWEQPRAVAHIIPPPPETGWRGVRVANTDRGWLPSFPVNLIAKLGNHREALRHCKSATLGGAFGPTRPTPSEPQVTPIGLRSLVRKGCVSPRQVGHRVQSQLRLKLRIYIISTHKERKSQSRGAAGVSHLIHQATKG